jgi:hypothetical protein
MDLAREAPLSEEFAVSGLCSRAVRTSGKRSKLVKQG